MKHFFLTLAASFLCVSFLCCQKGNDNDFDVNSKEELEKKLKEEVESRGLVSIAYSLVKNDKILHSGAVGFADQDRNIPATDNTRYLVASVSKTITAVALMQLVEQKRIALDDDINAFLPYSVRNPDYPDDKITYRMLLCHTSSISDDFQNTFDLDCFGTDCSMTLEQYFNKVFIPGGTYFSDKNFSNKAPGSFEDYSNLASALVGYLVERITKTPFDDYCKNNIFLPLGMTKTEWRLANTPISELAIPYSPEITSPNPHYTFPDYPNGGLRTNVLDLSKFLRAIILNGTLNGTQILTAASMAEMKKLQFESTAQCLSFYYEEFNNKKYLGHSGGEKGVTAEMYFDVSSNIGVIVFSNEEDAPLDNVMALLLNYASKQ
ncbi:MAG: class A beta-lactamase-related serine hydrolase [Cytophagales bacterium]|nr:MAG: class A beta-lactamase-related serine hydrolase [Cytophagales bacterium]